MCTMCGLPVYSEHILIYFLLVKSNLNIPSPDKNDLYRSYNQDIRSIKCMLIGNRNPNQNFKLQQNISHHEHKQ